jgi:hypothetical protein
MLTTILTKIADFSSQTKAIKRFTLFALMSMPLAALVAAVLAFTAANGGLILPLPGEWRMWIQDQSLGGMAALVSVMFLGAWLQFLVRMRGLFSQSKFKLKREVVIFVGTALLGALIPISIWPRPIVQVYVEPTQNNPAFHEHYFKIRGMKGETWYGPTSPWEPFVVRLTPDEQTAMNAAHTVYRCGHVARHSFAMFGWGTQLDFNNKPLRPRDAEQLRVNCAPGPWGKEVSATANARLEKVTDDGASPYIDESALAVAEGRIEDASPLNYKSRYLLFLYFPDALAKVEVQAVQAETDSNDSSTHGFVADDHIVATRTCDSSYARYLLTRGVMPDNRIVYVSVLKAMGAYEAELAQPNPITPESEENNEVPAAPGAICADLVRLYLESTTLTDNADLMYSMINSLNQLDLTAVSHEGEQALLTLLQYAGSIELVTWANANATESMKTLIQQVKPTQVSKKLDRSAINDLPYGGDKLFAAWGA